LLPIEFKSHQSYTSTYRCVIPSRDCTKQSHLDRKSREQGNVYNTCSDSPNLRGVKPPLTVYKPFLRGNSATNQDTLRKGLKESYTGVIRSDSRRRTQEKRRSYSCKGSIMLSNQRIEGKPGNPSVMTGTYSVL
jgi:hypothetical protein